MKILRIENSSTLSHVRKRHLSGQGSVDFLTEKDFDPCKPFFKNHPELYPESYDKILIVGVLEHNPFIRSVLKTCDYLLKPDGALSISYFPLSVDVPGKYVRPLSMLFYEVSKIFKERILLEKHEKKGSRLIFVWRKKGCALPEDDSIEKWSFGIVTNGKQNERVIQTISIIEKQNIPLYEVMICGPSFPCDDSHVRFLDDSDLYRDIRIPITCKKNRLIKEARYNNLVLLHDRILLTDDWFEKMQRHGNYFDCLSIPVFEYTSRNKRMNDWCTFTRTCNYNKFPHGKLQYDEWSPDAYVNGGAMIVKRHVIIRTMYDEYINWCEREDVDVSERMYIDGVLITMDSSNAFYSHAGYGIIINAVVHKGRPIIHNSIMAGLYRILSYGKYAINYLCGRLSFICYLREMRKEV